MLNKEQIIVMQCEEWPIETQGEKWTIATQGRVRWILNVEQITIMQDE